jgi:FAD/FMN-containing dehydrogenases
VVGRRAAQRGGCRRTHLDATQLSGITHFEPTELVITARAGTPLAEIEAALAEHHQFLPFEPPHFARTGRATLGGMAASAMSGPARISAGGVRDYVLGATLLSGKGEVLRFGGEVMKNVAGFDVSRPAVRLARLTRGHSRRVAQNHARGPAETTCASP